MEAATYVIAGQRPWNDKVYREVIRHFPGEWHFIGKSSDLSTEYIRSLKPRIIFFLHWSHKVPNSIIDAFECINFHMTDVPYGRGGSPLQNLIARGHRETMLTALKMSAMFDAGPVYLKRPMSLEGSTAEEIYLRTSYLTAEMIREIIDKQLRPVAQEGEPTLFKRRSPNQSRMLCLESLEDLHDFIRMLDADGYPRAFFEYDGFHYEFSRSSLYSGRIRATVDITPIESEKDVP